MNSTNSKVEVGKHFDFLPAITSGTLDFLNNSFAVLLL